MISLSKFRLSATIAVAMALAVSWAAPGGAAPTKDQQSTLFGGSNYPPRISGQAPVLYGDILHNTYFYGSRRWSGGVGNETTPFSAWLSAIGGTFARSSIKYVANSAGLYVLVAANSPAFEYNFLSQAYLGLSIEGARIAPFLWDRDLTNIAWIPLLATTAKDQIGVDGVANSASSIAATANGGTVSQSVTIASAQRVCAAFVKRITGIGIVSMSMDNSTFTPINLSLSWTRQQIPAQTLANPTLVFKLAVSGDEIAVDFANCENGPNVTSPMLTTTTAFTRSQDVLHLGVGWIMQAASTWLIGISPADPLALPIGTTVIDATQSNGVNRLVDISRTNSSINSIQFVAGSETTNLLDTSSYSYANSARIAFSASVSVGALSVNGQNSATGAQPSGLPPLTNITGSAVGSYFPDNSSPSFDHFQYIGYWPVVGSISVLQQLSTVPGFINNPAQNLISAGDSLAASDGASTPSAWWLADTASALSRAYFNGGVGGTTSTQMAASCTANTSQRNWLWIYWTGHNNPSPASTVVTDINTCISHQTTVGGKYLVLSPLQNSSNAYLSAAYNAVVSLRSALQTAFGANYVDIQSCLLANGNGSTADNNAIAQGFTPPSLQSDTIHLNNAGYAIAANCPTGSQGVENVLTAKGW